MQFVVEVGDKTYEGVLTQNPYDSNYEADIKASISTDDEVFVYLKFNGITEVVNLECIFKNFLVSSSTALDIAVDELVTNKKELNTSLDYECFIQILNKDSSANMYFWFVNIVSSEGDVFNVIVDVSTGEVLAKKL